VGRSPWTAADALVGLVSDIWPVLKEPDALVRLSADCGCIQHQAA